MAAIGSMSGKVGIGWDVEVVCFIGVVFIELVTAGVPACIGAEDGGPIDPRGTEPEKLIIY